MYERPNVHETTPPKTAPDHDDFGEGLELNHDEMEAYAMPIDQYAKMLSRTALKAVCEPQETNVRYMEDYRGTEPPKAA